MTWIGFALKTLAILAIYGGLVLAVERRAAPTPATSEWDRPADAHVRGSYQRKNRRQGRVA